MKLNGIPILSVDYQLRVAYPQAIQDILDVYLRLFTIQSAEQQANKSNRKAGSGQTEINQAEKL